MLKRFLFIFCLCLINIGANAVPNCPTTNETTQTECEQVAGCEWTLLYGCRHCSENKYYDGATKTCKNCPTSHPNSAVGSTNGISDCYKTCESETITGGSRVPSSDKAYHNTQCTYTITCNTTGAENCSTMGYHRDGNQCVPDVQSCGNNGYKFYINNTWSDCYVSSCPDGQTLVQKQSCGTTGYGECLTNAIPCNNATGLNKSACAGTITGTAPLLNGTTYDISQCACEKTSTQISNGTAGEKCFYNGTSNKFDTGCTYTVNACNAGYCSTDSQSCVTVPANHFSAADDKTCHKCPNGATSAAGSTAKTACHYTSTTTFADSVGNFTLPASGNIEIKWNWQ